MKTVALWSKLTLGLVIGLISVATAQPVAPTAARNQRLAAIEQQNGLQRLIVHFKDDLSAPAPDTQAARNRIQALSEAVIPAQATGLGLTYLKSVTNRTHVVRTAQRQSRSQMQALVQRLAQDPRVAYAEIDERVYPHFTPNDPQYAQQWALKPAHEQPGGVNLPNAWGRTVDGTPLNGTGVVVAVLDTGYRPHADLLANIIGGYDFIAADGVGDYTTANDGDGRDPSALDPGDWNNNANECDVDTSSWHGTHTAGIIGAVGNNALGLTGVAWGAHILPLRVLGVCGGYTSDTAAAIQWAVGNTVPGVPNNPHPARVISMSFGRSGSCSATYQAAISAAISAGATVVVSTGNDYSRSTITQPANCNGVIATTAHTQDGTVASYANTGAGTSISAPGDDIRVLDNTGTTVPGTDSYNNQSGTSFSAPHVAGVAALLYQIKPTATSAEVKSVLMASARAHPSGSYCASHGNDCGAGLLDAFRATQTLLQNMGVADHAPVIQPLATQYVLPGASLQFTVTATDAEGDAITFAATGVPNGATFDNTTGVFSWPKAGALGTYTVSIQPTDGFALGASTAVSIVVTNSIPTPPTTPATVPAGSGGGGGGALGWLDLAGVLVLALSSVALRRAQALPPHR
ncbi:MAG: S8 family serine peptidase [Rhodoferax sp.]